MTSKSTLRYSARAVQHRNPLVKQLFEIAEAKKTNLVISADLCTTKELLDIADKLGPYIAVFKTHIDIVADFGRDTIEGLKKLSEQHNFLIFEDRKFIDIGNTVQKQYHGGALRISEWAHLVNASILPGPSVVESLAQTARSGDFAAFGNRGLLILAEMTSRGSLAVGEYTKKSVEIARQNPEFVAGFVALRALSHLSEGSEGAGEDEDFVVFTTGVNRSSTGDALGQQYNTPIKAVAGGADFIISGRGIYAADDPVAAVKEYREEGWRAYLDRIGEKS